MGKRVDDEVGGGGAGRGDGGAVRRDRGNPDRDGALELVRGRDGEAGQTADRGGGQRADAATKAGHAGAVECCATRQWPQHGDGVVRVLGQSARVGERDGQIAGAVLGDGGRRGGFFF